MLCYQHFLAAHHLEGSLKCVFLKSVLVCFLFSNLGPVNFSSYLLCFCISLMLNVILSIILKIFVIISQDILEKEQLPEISPGGFWNHFPYL